MKAGLKRRQLLAQPGRGPAYAMVELQRRLSMP